MWRGVVKGSTSQTLTGPPPWGWLFGYLDQETREWDVGQGVRDVIQWILTVQRTSSPYGCCVVCLWRSEDWLVFQIWRPRCSDSSAGSSIGENSTMHRNNQQTIGNTTTPELVQYRGFTVKIDNELVGLTKHHDQRLYFSFFLSNVVVHSISPFRSLKNFCPPVFCGDDGSMIHSSVGRVIPYRFLEFLEVV